jgi:hypothetical protein
MATQTKESRWRQGFELRQEVREAIRRNCIGCFKYLDLWEAEVMLVVPLGLHGWVCVFGHPDQGSYEWVGRHDDDFEGSPLVEYEYSDQGYGCQSAALRDGLVQMVE